MISSLFKGSPGGVKAAIKTITSDISDPTKIRKIEGYENVFVSRGHGMRVMFKRDGEITVITSVSAEP